MYQRFKLEVTINGGNLSSHYALRPAHSSHYSIMSIEHYDEVSQSGELTFNRWTESNLYLTLCNNEIQLLATVIKPRQKEEYLIIEYRTLHYIFYLKSSKRADLVYFAPIEVTQTGFLSKEALLKQEESLIIALLSPNQFIRESAEQYA